MIDSAVWVPALRSLLDGAARRKELACPGRPGEYDFAFSRRGCVRVLHRACPPKDRGRRECRVHAAPAVSCAVSAKENAHEHTGEAEAVRHPLRSGFTAYIALSSGTGLSCPRHLQIVPADLASASGGRDHATSPYARNAVRLPAPPRPPHSRLTFRDDREAPLLARREWADIYAGFIF